MPTGPLEKNISLFVKRQFPAIYREDGPELVQLVEDYYKFSETQENQHIYQQRRFFETKDIDSTLESMIIFFKKKFLADLPLKGDIIRFIVKNILDLYRAKGTKRGIELFFAIFYGEHEIEIVYPAEKMQKISDSEWRQGVYLQMFPVSDLFISKVGKQYKYKDLLSRNIEGSVSKAKASVRSINFFILNGIKTAVIYLDGIQGTFQKYEDILSNIAGEVVTFGKTNGSLTQFEVDINDRTNLAGRVVGEVLEVHQKDGTSGKAIVTETTDEISGQIDYELADGGYGYTIANTRLLVSNQTMILDNGEDGYNQEFIVGELLRDQFNREGIVIGQTEYAVGIRMNSGQQFDYTSFVSTVRPPIIVSGVSTPQPQLTINLALLTNAITSPNSSSPGDLFPDTADDTDVIVSGLSDTSVASVITDVISPYVAVTLDAADYGAITPMSGTASPVVLTTVLSDAFDIQDFTIGRIIGFDNINPGSNYTNDVFAIAQDSAIKNLDRKNQIVSFNDAGDAGSFSVGDRVVGITSGVNGLVKETNPQRGYIVVTPFNYSGLNTLEDIALAGYPSGAFAVKGIESDYRDPQRFGDNAIINSTTEFAIGKVKTVNILSSGFGYVSYGTDFYLPSDSTTAQYAKGKGELRDADGLRIASGFISAETQGVTGGYWAGQNSHISGYKELSAPVSSTSIKPQAMGVLSTQLFLNIDPLTNGYPGLPMPAYETWFTSIASDGFAMFDMTKQGFAFSGTSGIQFELLRQNTASDSVTTRWNNIVAPSLQSQSWYASQVDVVWKVDQITYTYDQEYYDSGNRVQDSNFYQEYSYQIKSTLPIGEYEQILKENVHLAGTKLFGDFSYKAYVGGTIKPRFLRLFNDDGRSTPFDQADITELRASVTNYTADSTYVAASHSPGGAGGLVLSPDKGSDLTVTKNWSQGFHDYDVTIGMPSSGSAPYPVAILLHGNGGSGADLVTEYSAVLPGHILIGVEGYEQSWNISMETSKGPDIEMLKELLTNLKLYNNINEEKIRIIGISNGGALALRAAVEIVDTGVDVITCMISQSNTDQYRNNLFYYPSNEEQTGDAYPNDGYDLYRNPLPQRRLLLMNGTTDNVVPYNGGVGSILNSQSFLSANDSAYRFAQAQGWAGNQALFGGPQAAYGSFSVISDYGNVVWLRDVAGHSVTDDMKYLLGQYLENDYDIVTQPSAAASPLSPADMSISDITGSYPSTTTITVT
tara:strand:- start:1477 stop:5142 length:3666 start_codon:yes stop_codon:yes gene_type:complete